MNQNNEMYNVATLKYGYREIDLVALRGSPYIVGNTILKILDLSLNNIVHNIIDTEIVPMENGVLVVDGYTLLVNLKGLYTLLNLGNTKKYRMFERWAMDNLYPIWTKKAA